MARSSVDFAYRMLTSDDDGRVCKDIPESACNEEPRNFLTHVASLAATKIADGLIDPKLVLSWILTQVSAPAAIIGLLVPVREAGALLPQLFTAGALRALPLRKVAWVGGAMVQGLAALAIAISALTLEGLPAGIAIITALAVLAIARSVCSVTYKDVLGKTVSKSRRGTATGAATALAAGMVLLFGALLASGLIARMTLVTAGLFVATILWWVAAGMFASLRESPGATEGGANPLTEARKNIALLLHDAQLRRFIATRALLVATALAPPFMVSLGSREPDGNAFGGLGLLVIASSLASLLSSYVWGRLADRSSRWVLVLSAGAASLALAATVALNSIGVLQSGWALPGVLFALMIAYQGVRLGRATHLVDMAGTDTRAAYTALSNTIIGLILVFGSAFSLLAELYGEAVVLTVLAAMSALAIPMALSLEEVQGRGE